MMIQRFFILLCLFIAALSFEVPVFADQLSASAIVLPARMIHLDKNGDIDYLTSNTIQNTSPVVANGSYSSTIEQQYQKILSDNGGNLGAGVYDLTSSEKSQLAAERAFQASIAKLEFY